MAMISFDEVLKLKEAVKNEFGEKVHFHDQCGGQYFTLEVKNNRALQSFIEEYFKKLKLKAEFSDDGSSFDLV